MVVHVSVWLDGAEAWEGEPILTTQLAEVNVGVSILALLWSLFRVIFVEEINLVDIFGAPLDSINWIIEEAGRLPHSRDKSTAHHGLAVVPLTRVLPAIFLYDSHCIFKRHVPVSGFDHKFSDVLSLSAKMLVDGL